MTCEACNATQGPTGAPVVEHEVEVGGTAPARVRACSWPCLRAVVAALSGSAAAHA